MLYNISRKTPESIDSKQLDQYNVIIAVEQRHRASVLKKCSECKNKIVVGDIPDKIFFLRGLTERINAQMKKKVTEFAESLT